MSHENEFTSDERAYRVRVVESLARLETMAASTDEHLRRVNGSVARHEERLGMLWHDVLKHPMECPVRAEVERMKQALAVDEATARATEKWWARVSPLIWIVVGALLVLFLLHAKELLPLFTHAL